MFARALCAACCALLTARARADDALFFPGDDMRRGAEERELAQRVETLLRARPELDSAQAIVRLPRAAEVALDQPLAAPALTVVLRERDAAHPIAREHVIDAAQRAGLGARVDVQLTRASANSPAPVQVGQRTERGSERPARALTQRLAFFLSLVGNVALATLLLWPALRRVLERVHRSKVS